MLFYLRKRLRVLHAKTQRFAEAQSEYNKSLRRRESLREIITVSEA
jgi:hypothetical protein